MTLAKRVTNFFGIEAIGSEKRSKRITKEKREQRNARIVTLYRQGSYVCLNSKTSHARLEL